MNHSILPEKYKSLYKYVVDFINIQLHYTLIKVTWFDHNLSAAFPAVRRLIDLLYLHQLLNDSIYYGNLHNISD